MTQHSHLLASLIGSRICHDLISPVGAIQNGLELLSLDGSLRGPEMMLISESATAASAKIKFLRVAFGLPGDGQKMGRREIAGILDGLGGGNKRITYDWTPMSDVERRTVQEVFLALLCFESGMPAGGTITVTPTEDGAGWDISGPVQKSRPNPQLWNTLVTGEDVEAISPAHVQFALLPSMIADRHGRIALRERPDGITVTL